MNMKKTIVCLLAMAVVVLCQSLTACKDKDDTPDDEQPQLRDTTITFNFKLAQNTAFASSAVQGTLLLAEWNNVIAQLPAIINTAYTADPDKGGFDWVFNNDATIIVEKNPAYTKYKVPEYTGINDDTEKGKHFQKLYLNYAYLVGNATDKSATIIEAVIKMASWEAGYQ